MSASNEAIQALLNQSQIVIQGPNNEAIQNAALLEAMRKAIQESIDQTEAARELIRADYQVVEKLLSEMNPVYDTVDGSLKAAIDQARAYNNKYCSEFLEECKPILDSISELSCGISGDAVTDMLSIIKAKQKKATSNIEAISEILKEVNSKKMLPVNHETLIVKAMKLKDEVQNIVKASSDCRASAQTSHMQFNDAIKIIQAKITATRQKVETMGKIDAVFTNKVASPTVRPIIIHKQMLDARRRAIKQCEKEGKPVSHQVEAADPRISADLLDSEIQRVDKDPLSSIALDYVINIDAPEVAEFKGAVYKAAGFRG